MSYLTLTIRWTLIAMMAMGAPLWCCCVAGPAMGGAGAEIEMAAMGEGAAMSCHGAHMDAGMGSSEMPMGGSGDLRDMGDMGDEPCDCGHEDQAVTDVILSVGLNDVYALSAGFVVERYVSSNHMAPLDHAVGVLTDRGPPPGRSLCILLGRFLV